MWGILRRRRGFAHLWSAGVISSVGDWVLFIPLPIYVYSLTGSALATGTMFMALTVPRVLLSSPAGVFADRWDRRRTMIAADLARAGLLLALLMVRSAEWVWLVYVVAFVQAAIGQFFMPARAALLPLLVPREERIAANSLEGVSGALTGLIAPSLGGVLVGLVGLSGVVLADCASFVLSAALIWSIRMDPAPMEGPAAAVAARWAGIRRDWVDGLRWVSRQRLIALLCAASWATMVGYGLLSVLLVVFVKGVLKGGALEYGWVLTAQGVGAMAGGLAIAQVGRRASAQSLAPLGLAAAGLLYLAMFNLRSLPAAVLFAATARLALSSWLVSAQTLFQNGVDDRHRGRVYGFYETGNALLMLAGMGLASLLADRAGAVPMLDLAGALYLVAALIALGMLPAMRRAGQANGRVA